MHDISEILRNLLDQYTEVSDVDQEFARMLCEDEELQADYQDWCEANGLDPKTGYQDHVDELLAQRDSIWDNLNEL